MRMLVGIDYLIPSMYTLSSIGCPHLYMHTLNNYTCVSELKGEEESLYINEILSSDTKQCVAFSQCTAPVFQFQNVDFPINENEDAQVCVIINPFETQTSEELTIEFTIMPGQKAGMY